MMVVVVIMGRAVLTSARLSCLGTLSVSWRSHIRRLTVFSVATILILSSVNAAVMTDNGVSSSSLCDNITVIVVLQLFICHINNHCVELLLKIIVLGRLV